MSVSIVRRKDWGALPWSGEVHPAEPAWRTHILFHYHGNPPPVQVGPQVPREVDRIHHDNGWSGVGYNFLIDMAGRIYEGRGWNLVGAHCPGYNRAGIGIYLAIGGSQVPTMAAYRSARTLAFEADQVFGRFLTRSWHKAHWKTECPGEIIPAWVRSGMPAAPTKEDGVLSDTDVQRVAKATADLILKGQYGPPDARETLEGRIAHIDAMVDALATQEDLAALEARLEGKLARIEHEVTQ